MADTKTHRLPQIFVLSGGTGRTADQLLRAALAQFPSSEVDIVHHVAIRSKERAVEIVRKASDQGALVCHSLVDPTIRMAVDAELRRRGVPCIDVLGPSLSLLGDHLGKVPQGRAGLMYTLHHEQVDRMDAMDFTLAHDDGNRLADLKHADVVLVGASRTSKSVTCFYLAFRGIRAGNVPLVPGHPLPVELTRISPRRVIGLTMNAAHLEAIRQSRMPHISAHPVPRYAERLDIQAELREVRHLMASHHWECVDVSYMATEEVAARIIEMLPRRRRSRRVPRAAGKKSLQSS